jgi:hypothetical protein
MPPHGFDAVRHWGLRTLKPDTMLRLSVVGLALDLLIAASTLVPGAPLVPEWPQFVLFPFIFVVHFSSVLRLTCERGRFRWREFLAGLPPVLVVGFTVLFVGVWLAEMSSITGIGGQPTMSGGRYYLDHHGSLVPVTKAAYEHALMLQQRIFTLGPSVFFALGLLVHYPRATGGGMSRLAVGSPGGAHRRASFLRLWVARMGRKGAVRPAPSAGRRRG